MDVPTRPFSAPAIVPQSPPPSAEHPRDTPAPAPDGRSTTSSRRGFLRAAGIAAGAAAVSGIACAPTDDADETKPEASADRVRGETPPARRSVDLDGPTLSAIGDVVLPASIGPAARATAVTAFIEWVRGYEPVAEEMHGYGYSDIRYLPADPAPAWRAQLDGLDLIARKIRGKRFVDLQGKAREDVLATALSGVRGDRLPAPLGAPHVALALLSHWASGPAAWNLALGAQVSPATCRPLDGVKSRPLPIVGA